MTYKKIDENLSKVKRIIFRVINAYDFRLRLDGITPCSNYNLFRKIKSARRLLNHAQREDLKIEGMFTSHSLVGYLLF